MGAVSAVHGPGASLPLQGGPLPHRDGSFPVIFPEASWQHPEGAGSARQAPICRCAAMKPTSPNPRPSRPCALALRPMATLLAVWLGIATPGAYAQSVALTGVMGSRALLVIDGAPPAVVAQGQTTAGVTLIETDDQTAVVEVQGRRQSLRVGESPVRLGASGGGGSGQRIVLHAGTGGHFTGVAQFNGSTLPFVVDTGASDVVLAAAQAAQIGLDYRKGTAGAVVTANGTVQAWRVHLDSVRVGDVALYNVEAMVVLSAMPFALLGNSFLSRFQLRQENDQLTLDKRY